MTIEEILEHVTQWISEKRTGSIQINFFKGGISNLNLTQSIKTEKTGGCHGEKEAGKKSLAESVHQKLGAGVRVVR